MENFKKEINGDQVLKEAINLLQYLISINTSRGGEIQLAKYLSQLFQNQRIEARVYEPKKGRGSLIAHLPGGTQPPLILLSHLDTAPVREEKWTFPPFSGKIKEKEILGRGAIDCKGLLTIHAALIKIIIKYNLKLNRDIYLVSTAGEEEGGTSGCALILNEYPELKKAEYVLSEGGGFRIKTETGKYQLCQVGEKGRLKLLVKSKISSPRLINYAQKSTQEVKNNNKLPQPVLIKDKVDTERIYSNQVKYKEEEIVLETVPNIINIQKFISKFSSYVKKKDPQAKILISEWTKGKISTRETKLYKTIKKITKQESEAEVVPYITPGYSDNRFFRKNGITVYGYQPLLGDYNPSWIHGVGERISINSLEFGIKLLFNIINKAFI